ncbi:hypothetical protein PI124_g17101 [Phytophthora idaei]|nr:hypothetical protein PI125_g17633 [Phytophthora idaei]KAG3129638.1 hypothetical protein PI126_g20873 [Phytophthora idaei]KAG3237927.1 hypothetical protein PI124_g17101 [Phytophthora idaei]
MHHTVRPYVPDQFRDDKSIQSLLNSKVMLLKQANIIVVSIELKMAAAAKANQDRRGRSDEEDHGSPPGKKKSCKTSQA